MDRQTQGRMSILQKLKQKLAGKSLTEHLCWKHGAEKEVGAGLMLEEIRKDDNPTPH